jgi:hypothetical protein
MGQHVNAQGNKDSDYVKAVYEYDFVFCFEISMARGEIFLKEFLNLYKNSFAKNTISNFF